MSKSKREFRAGDVVMLRSRDGPRMVLGAYRDGTAPGEVFPEIGWPATWFCQGALRHAVFRPEILMLAPAVKPPGAKTTSDSVTQK
jgi:uncharacterized protein YodC (DUF2158 family)